MQPRSLRATQPGRRAGFSLVEITLALGICSFGLVAVLGLLPIGLTTARRAMDVGAQAQIMRQISSTLGQTRYGDLPAMNNTSLYFDDQGIELTISKASQAAFQAKLSLRVSESADQPLPVPTDLPMGEMNGIPSPRLATIWVDITVNGNAQSQVRHSLYIVDRGW